MRYSLDLKYIYLLIVTLYLNIHIFCFWLITVYILCCFNRTNIGKITVFELLIIKVYKKLCKEIKVEFFFCLYVIGYINFLSRQIGDRLGEHARRRAAAYVRWREYIRKYTSLCAKGTLLSQARDRRHSTKQLLLLSLPHVLKVGPK